MSRRRASYAPYTPVSDEALHAMRYGQAVPISDDEAVADEYAEAVGDAILPSVVFVLAVLLPLVPSVWRALTN